VAELDVSDRVVAVKIHEFCAEVAAERAMQGDPSRAVKILDYGCGAGEIVELLQRVSPHVTAYGCDIFYEGGSYLCNVNEQLLSTGVIREMKHGCIPFGDAEFDVVLSNQVMEHVEDLETVTREIARVLKPGGFTPNLFPDISVWREGHCGIPFLHWYRSGSRWQIMHAITFRALGFGYFKEGKSVVQWSRDFCHWLEKWTRYRSYEVIRRIFGKHFGPMVHIEESLLAARLGSRAWLTGWLPRYVQQRVVRKLGGLVFYCEKPF